MARARLYQLAWATAAVLASAILVFAVVTLLGGCVSRTSRGGEAVAPGASTEATGTTGVDESATESTETGTEGTGVDEPSGGSSGSGGTAAVLDDEQLESLTDELEAMEDELDALEMPDNDFSDIEALLD
ncbi:MAG: hypothetical protein Kow0056_08940 [Coriobacteriia bacterium]